MNYIDCKDKESLECLNSFIDSISNEVSVNCSIPFNIPRESIQQIVENTLNYFYQNYEDAVEDQYLAIDKKQVLSKAFAKSIDKNTKDSMRGRLMLPDNVFSVYGVYELNGYSGEASWGTWGHNFDRNLNIRNQVFSMTMNKNVSIAADNTAYWICTESFLDQARQLFQNMIGFHFNRLTHRITFMDKLPYSDVILHVGVKVNPCQLFDDWYFRRMVIADCKTQMGRILNAFSYQLPGNISINVDAIVGEGMSEREMVIQELKDMRSNWYILTN